MNCFIISSVLLVLLLQFDMDGDGEITTEELKLAMNKLLGENMSPKEIDAVVREVDNNGDGTVDFEGVNCEMRAAVSNPHHEKYN